MRKNKYCHSNAFWLNWNGFAYYNFAINNYLIIIYNYFIHALSKEIQINKNQSYFDYMGINSLMSFGEIPSCSIISSPRIGLPEIFRVLLACNTIQLKDYK